MAEFLPNQKLPAAQLNASLAAKANQSDLVTVSTVASAAAAAVNTETTARIAGDAQTLSSALGAVSPTAQRTNAVFVIAITGQSNAAGANNGGPNPGNNRVKVWDGTTGNWGSSDYTQNPFARAQPDGNLGNNNIALAFAHRLVDEFGAKVYIIYDAVGGRPIEDWVSAGTSSVRYAAIKTKIQAALASPELVAAGKTTIDYLIWAQGEENALTDQFSDYGGKFTTLDAQFRAETWMNFYTPMFVMGMSGLHTRYQVWQAQLDYCENSNRACVYVNSAGLQTGYDVNGFLQMSVDNTVNFNAADTITQVGPNGTATATVVTVGTGFLTANNVSGVFSAGFVVTSSSGGSASVTAIASSSDYTHWLGNSLWTFGYQRVWYALQERAVGHRQQPAPFYGRGTGPWRGSTVAITLFKSLVSYSSATSTFPLNGPGASDSISFGFQCSGSNNSIVTGFQNTQDSLARYGMMGGRSNAGTSGADYHMVGGFQNTASATYALAAGRGHTVADSGGAAVGLFSKYTTTQTNNVLFQVGCGTTLANSKNAITCRSDGTVELNGAHTSDPTQQKEITLEWVSNTSLKIKMRGTDSVVRSVTLTLA